MVRKKVTLVTLALALSLASCDTNGDSAPLEGGPGTAPSNSDLAAFGFNTPAEFENIRDAASGFQRWTILTFWEGDEMERDLVLLWEGGRTIEQFNAIADAVKAVFDGNWDDQASQDPERFFFTNDRVVNNNRLSIHLRHEPDVFSPTEGIHVPAGGVALVIISF